MRKAIHDNLFWLYGVIVALAIREGLSSTIPRILTNPGEAPWLHFRESVRLIVFLFICVRFFVGSVLYYDETYFSGEEIATEIRKGYTVDFIFGFWHFILIFGWSLTIQSGTGPYLSVLAVVLLYDLVWVLFCKNARGKQRVAMWTAINLLTVVVAGFFFFLLYFGLVEWAPELDGIFWAELAALGVVVFASIIDFIDLVIVGEEESLIAEFLIGLIPSRLIPERVIKEAINGE